MTLNKEILTFAASLVLAVLLIALGGGDDAAGGRGGRRGGGQGDLKAPTPAFAAPKFVADETTTWSGEGRNIFEAPSDLKPLPPLELAPPPASRPPLGAPPFPVRIGAAAARALRRPYAPDPAKLADGGAPASPTTSEAEPAPAEATTPDENVDKPLSAADKARLSAEERIAREKERQRLAALRALEDDRLDKITFGNGVTMKGEFAGSTEKDKNRYEAKRAFEEIRRSGSLTEAERTERLKKITFVFYEVRNKKRGARQLVEGDKIVEIKLADTPVNRFQERRLELEGRDLALQLELVRTLFPVGETKLAAEALTVLKARGQYSAEACALLADAQHAESDYNAELATTREGAKLFPEAGPVWSRLGRALAKIGLNAEAKDAFAKALDKDVADQTANAGLGEILLREGRAQAALAPLREAVNATKAEPGRVEAARLRLAEAHLALGDAKNAQAQLDVVTVGFKADETPATMTAERRRLHRRTFALAAAVALAQGRAAEARAAAETGLKSHPDDGPLTFALGVAAYAEGKLGEAKRLLESVPELDPLLTARAGAALSLVLEQGGADAAALAAAETAVTTADPSDPSLKLPYGRALLNAGDVAKAREQLVLALDDEPDDADTLTALGDAAYAEQALAEAIRFYDRASRIDAEYPDLLGRRIVTHVRRKRLDEAEKLVGAAGGASAKGAFLQAAVAYFHYARGNHAESLGLLKKLAETERKDSPEQAYGQAAYAAITAHQNRQLWTDQFGRTDAKIGREWKSERGAGVNVALAEQQVRFEGKQAQVSDVPTYLWQERQGDRVYGFSVDLAFPAPMPGVYAGAGIMAIQKATVANPWTGFQKREGGFAPFSGLQVALSPEGKLVWRKLEKAAMSEWQPVPGAPEGATALTLEFRQTDFREGKWSVLVNRETLLRDVEVPDLKRWRRPLELQVFCHGVLGSTVKFSVDNVAITTWKGE